MKIQCDVCNKDEATVFCTADEAALCDACDHRVHHANKLASKHQRFTLLHPVSSSSSKQVPLCDICQEKRAFLFCQQDRSILCRDCDGPIHSANEHTQKHNRFLLTGVKLSSTSTLYTSSSSSNGSGDSVPQFSLIGNEGSTTSSISEYLMEMLPGWHFEDFLDSFSETPFDSNMTSSGLWVPQSPSFLYSSQMAGGPAETKEITSMKGNNKRWTSDSFTVPQISHPSASTIGSNKRSRTLW